MAARWTAGLVWAAAAASIVFWGLRLGVQGEGVPDRARWVDTERVARGDVSRLFAQAPDAAAPVAASSRFRVLGVMAAEHGGSQGWAVISVDGKPARAVRVGGGVDGDIVVLQVAARKVELGPRGGPATTVVELPGLPAATRGEPGAAGNAPPPLHTPPTSSMVPNVQTGMPSPPSEAAVPPPNGMNANAPTAMSADPGLAPMPSRDR